MRSLSWSLPFATQQLQQTLHHPTIQILPARSLLPHFSHRSHLLHLYQILGFIDRQFRAILFKTLKLAVLCHFFALGLQSTFHMHRYSLAFPFSVFYL